MIIYNYSALSKLGSGYNIIQVQNLLRSHQFLSVLFVCVFVCAHICLCVCTPNNSRVRGDPRPPAAPAPARTSGRRKTDSGSLVSLPAPPALPQGPRKSQALMPWAPQPSALPMCPGHPSCFCSHLLSHGGQMDSLSHWPHRGVTFPSLGCPWGRRGWGSAWGKLS